MKEVVRLCILVACVMTIIGIDCMCLLYVSCLLHVSVNWLHVSVNWLHVSVNWLHVSMCV